ncbi:MAG: metallohydrolase [Castellaniella sp.]|uniref:metallohydrolase n=1 Tax=Castellaniella sp. TaxID=1955812 RepID=UPI0012061A94|nr:metallohydrolase [Castellaniella sp.]TAN29643.1 MAG: metallohydrolase [Castellaniella sp.]
MGAMITFFPVGCGDMALVRLADEPASFVLVDVNIRIAADNPDDDTRDVGKDLRDRLPRDAKGRPYVDAFLLSHPDKDHSTGLEKHFHLGPITDYPDDDRSDAEKRIVIREIWSSPMVFRRASKTHTLCADAKAFNREAKRRVQRFKDGWLSTDGERVLILGEDENGKTDDLTAILIMTGDRFRTINGRQNDYFEAHLLAPRSLQSDDDEALLSKNHSSTILNMRLASSILHLDSCRFLTAGDAEVAIWERLWKRYQATPDVLAYDLLLAPHHCSWHSLSYDSWSQLGEDATLAPDARSALAQARFGAMIVASAKPIQDDDSDPPCIRAKREYKSILANHSGVFLCTSEEPNATWPEPLEIEVTAAGAKRKQARARGVAAATIAAAPRAG